MYSHLVVRCSEADEFNGDREPTDAVSFLRDGGPRVCFFHGAVHRTAVLSRSWRIVAKSEATR